MLTAGFRKVEVDCNYCPEAVQQERKMWRDWRNSPEYRNPLEGLSNQAIIELINRNPN